MVDDGNLLYRNIFGNLGEPQAYEVMIDRTSLTITGSASPPVNGNGWNNGDVTVQWTCYDIVPCSLLPGVNDAHW
jgi:hypothetical protein